MVIIVGKFIITGYDISFLGINHMRILLWIIYSYPIIRESISLGNECSIILVFSYRKWATGSKTDMVISSGKNNSNGRSTNLMQKIHQSINVFDFAEL